MPSQKHIDILNKHMVGQKITEVRWLTKEQTESTNTNYLREWSYLNTNVR